MSAGARSISCLAITALAACAPPPAASLPIPAPSPRPRDPRAPDAAPPATAPGVCIPDADRTTVSRLESDPRTVRACFVAPGDDERCVAIDRKRGAITPWDAPQPAPAIERPGPTLRILDQSFFVCAYASGLCGTIPLRRRSLVDTPITVAADARADLAVAVLPDPAGRDVPWFDVYDVRHHARIATITLSDGNRCGDASGLAGLIMITTDDCDAHTGHGYLVDGKGALAARVGGAHDVDTYGATAAPLDDGRAAILAPWARALVIVRGADPTRQLVIDLAPIVAHATDAPSFVVAPDTAHTWLVASSTGGVGVFDPDATRLRASWTIPTCAAPPPAPPAAATSP